MKKIYLLTVLLLLSATSVFSQTNLRQGRIHKSENVEKSKVIDIPILQPSSIINNDTLYCSRTKKQNGWFAPLDTISKEVASHRNHCFRFTNKNQAGNWSRMECIDGYGNYVKGTMSPYILKLGNAYDTDQDANQEWIEKLKTTCVYEFIADYSGKVIVQERAYDEDMNLIYTYSRVPIGNKQYIGSYKDCYGLPAEMRSSEDYTYGTLVKITEDEYGNDSIIQYVDAKGVPKLNSDSVAMEVYIHDKYGRLIKQQSRNADGTLTIDNWGNCGVEYKWNDKHDIISATYMDDKWQPMRMPGNRENTGRENIIRTNYIYDEYRRQIAEYYTDIEGNPDVNKLGTHKIIYEFNDRGNIIEQRGYNKNNELSPMDLSGDAIEVFEFNNEGKILAARFYDKNQKLNSKEGYLCRVDWVYDGNGNEISVKRYSITNGIEKLASTEQRNSNYIYTLWNDGSSRVDSLDSKGRTTFIGFYDANGNLEMNGGRAYECYTYFDEEKKTTQIEVDFDLNRNKVDVSGICKTITVSDSIRWTQTKWRYDKNDVLKEIFIHQYDKGFNKLLSQDDANIFGIKSRSGGSSEVRYYTGDIVYSHKGKFASLLGRDEFGEPDYITSNSVTYYYTKGSSNADSKRYDEENNEVKDVDELRDRLPKVMTIEVVDSIAYSRGLRDNDVILLYGDYSVNLDEISSYFQFRRDWALRTILDARKNKRMVVFRIEDASKNQYGLVEIDNLEGTPSELGFLAHIRYLTKKQSNRIREAINKNLNGDRPIVSKNDFAKKEAEGKHYIIMAFTEMYRSYREKPYAKQITDPAILIGACIRDKNMYWNLNDGENTQVFESMLDSRKKQAFTYPSMDYYLTTDMTSVSHLFLDEQAVYTNWFDTKISDEDYALLLDLNKSVKKELEANSKMPYKYAIKDLTAAWEISPNDEALYHITGSIQLLKAGESKGSLINYGKISFNEGDAIYKIDTDYTGKWEYYGGNIITFTPNKEDNITLSCVDLIGADEELKERAVAYMNSICEENKSSLLERMSFINAPLGNDWFIKSFNKQVLLLDDGSDKGMSLVKIKQKQNNSKDLNKPQVSKKKQIDNISNIPIIGEWETTIPEFYDANVKLEFADDKTMSLSFIINYKEALSDSLTANALFAITLGGDWEVETEMLTIKHDAAKTKIDCDVKVEGTDAKSQKQLEEELKKYFESIKDEFALALLKENPFNGSIPFKISSSNKLTINEITFDKIEEKKSIIIATAKGDEGYFTEQGYSGLFVVLEWCEWDCSQSIEVFSKEFEKRKNSKKNILLLPVESVDGYGVFKDIIKIKCPKGKLGLHIQEITVSQSYYQDNILNRYNEWK